MCTKDPATIKKLGREVLNFDDKTWGVKRPAILLTALREKFRQNPELSKKLVSTGTAPLGEASPTDAIYGIGMSASNDKARNAASWPGRNLLGRSLQQVRNEIRFEEARAGALAAMAVGRSAGEHLLTGTKPSKDRQAHTRYACMCTCPHAWCTGSCESEFEQGTCSCSNRVCSGINDSELWGREAIRRRVAHLKAGLRTMEATEVLTTAIQLARAMGNRTVATSLSACLLYTSPSPRD